MTPEERHALVMKPFPAIEAGDRHPRTYPWAGTIINDNFFGDGSQPKRKPNAGAYMDAGLGDGYAERGELD